MEQLVRVAKMLRLDHGFKGYIHLKTIPDANDDLIAEAGLYADRLSINIELPTENDLQALAPEKKRKRLEANMATVDHKIKETKSARRAKLKPPVFTPAGQSTQMIIGATPTEDREILATASNLYSAYKLRRVYYSAFSPIPDAHSGLPLKNPPLMREHRLYQADWMLRFYGYTVDEITPIGLNSLRLDVDPKTSWALNNRAFFPLNVNKASKEALLRIPGIGVQNVKRILSTRRHRAIRMEDLKKMRCALKRARPFIITADYQPGSLLEKADLLPYLLAPAQKNADKQMELAL